MSPVRSSPWNRRTPERVGGVDLPNHNCGSRDLLTAVVISDTNAQIRLRLNVGY
jgi:hypothetical protein